MDLLLIRSNLFVFDQKLNRTESSKCWKKVTQNERIKKWIFRKLDTEMSVTPFQSVMIEIDAKNDQNFFLKNASSQLPQIANDLMVL